MMTAAEEIADYRDVRPHLVVLGAGASRAAFPAGELQGRQLPLMADFAEIVPVAPILEKSGIAWQGKNFEEVYSTLAANPAHSEIQRDLEGVVSEHFSDLRLPETPTLYDLLVLCLRKKDVIATFNWDPFLIQALQRSHRVTKNLPTPLFLHGNVAHGYCDRDRFQGSRGAPCLRCGEPLRDDRLLFPVAKKDYSADASISKAWEVMREALKNSLVVTVFGYSAPASDKDALSLMSDAWGKPANRQFELFEILDIRPKDEVRASWTSFIFSGHYQVNTNFMESLMANHPRRSIETFLNRYVDGKFIEGNRVIDAANLGELHSWFKPLIEAEKTT
jgi:hypothetical protein